MSRTMSIPEKRFADMYDAHSRDIYAYCRRRANAERTDDALSETFLVAWRRLDSVPEGREQLLWLYGVAHRVLSQQRRSFRRRQRLEKKLDGVGITPLDTPEFLVILREEAAMALEASERLNKTDSEVLRLSVWEELSHKEIAAVLGIKPGAVKQRLHRARINLTKEFNQLESKPKKSPAAQKGGVW